MKYLRQGILVFLLSILFLGCTRISSKENDSVLNVNDKKFEVLSFSPTGELSPTNKYPVIQIQFSKPVVPLEKLGLNTDSSDIISINPSLKGRFIWYGTSLLSFESSEEILPQRKYTVSINKKTVSIQGESIKGPLEYSFFPQRLLLTSLVVGFDEINKGKYISQDDVPVDLAKNILVNFNCPVDCSIISKTIEVTSLEGQKFTFKAKQENPSTLRITLNETPEIFNTISVTLLKGSKATNDCFPTEQDQTQSFYTLRPFGITNCYPNANYLPVNYTNPIQIIFNHPITEKLDEVVKHISTDPIMNVTENNIVIKENSMIIHSLPVTYNSKFKLIIDCDLSDIYGLKLGSTFTKEIKIPEARSFVEFKEPRSKVMLESQFDPKIAFRHQNLIKENSFYEISSTALANGSSCNNNKIKVEYKDKDIPQDIMVTEAIDLKPFLQSIDNEYRGEVNIIGNFFTKYKKFNWKQKIYEDSQQNNEFNCDIQVTDLGVTTRYGYNKALVLVTSLKTGQPIKNAHVSFLIKSQLVKSSSFEGTTDNNGFAIIDFEPEVFKLASSTTLIVKTENDYVTFNPDITNMWRTQAYTSTPEDVIKKHQVVFMFTDRGLYRPGEVMTFRGIGKELQFGEYNAFYDNYNITISDDSYNQTVYYSKDGYTSTNGTFWGQWKIPEDIAPGDYRIIFKSHSKVISSISFSVQFFERLRFEVKTTIPEVTNYSGDKINAKVSAQYLGGGSLGTSFYSSYWTREPSGFVPTDIKFAKMTFGPLQGYDGRNSLDTNEGLLSNDGNINLSIQTGGEKLKGMAYSYRIETKITDSGNQMINSSATTIVHPARFYLGLSSYKSINGFPKKNEKIKFDYICITPTGQTPVKKDLPSNKPILRIELLREKWNAVQQIGWNGQINTRYVREMITEQEQKIELIAKDTPTEFSVIAPKGGSYVLRLSTQDSHGNEIITERNFFVIGSDWAWYNNDNTQEISMTCDKSIYEPGETAQILVQSALPKGTYLQTIEREGIVSHKLFTLDEPSTVISIPVEENFVPVMYVTLSSYSVRTVQPTHTFDTPDLDKPKGYFGLVTIHVNPSIKKFNVDIKADKTAYKPGEEVTVNLHASKDNKPISGAEITLMAVDRGVIDHINYHVPDPLKYFYDEYLFADGNKGGDSRSYLMDPVTYEIRNLIGGDSNNNSLKSEERSNFEPTALFIPSLLTDENGDVSYSFNLPDSLTSYRITAVGVKENSFSLDESQIDVANPISVRDVLPRKLRLNDEGEVGTVVTNLDNKPHDVIINLILSEGLDKLKINQSDDEVQKLPGKASVISDYEKTITITPNTTIPVMFKIKAELQGWITVEYKVTSDIVNENILKPLEIEKNYLFETVTTIGQINDIKKIDSVEEKIKLPVNTDDQNGSLYVKLDSSQLGILKEAVNYVFEYPYGCLEQRTACIFPLLAFSDYLNVFDLDNVVKNAKSVCQKEINSWGKSQLSDGSFPYWPSSNSSSIFVTLRIGEIIALAKEKGLSVKSINIEKLIKYLQSVYNKFDSNYTYNIAYSTYVLTRLGGKPDLSNINIKNVTDISTLCYLALAYLEENDNVTAQQIANKVRKEVKYSTQGLDINESLYWSFFNGRSEDYALMLQLFTKLNRHDEINRRIVYELINLQKKYNGYWKSTSETTRVLISLAEYIKTNNLEDTDFTAEVLLADDKIMDAKFDSLKAKPVETVLKFTDSPLNKLKSNTEIPLILNKNGNGNLFYTVSMKHAIPLNEQKPRDNGLCLYSQIVDLITGETVNSDKLILGRVYKKIIYLSSTYNRSYLALRVPIPCGCEILNAAFETTGTFDNVTLKQDIEENSYDDLSLEDELFYKSIKDNFGLTYQRIYDCEVQYFWDYFIRGNQKVEFLFRATRTGKYNTPPSTAECMYEPEINGNDYGKNWEIE